MEELLKIKQQLDFDCQSISEKINQYRKECMEAIEYLKGGKK
jgi:hypothetical protein